MKVESKKTAMIYAQFKNS